MNSFKDIFKEKAFIGFVTAGDPDIYSTEEFIYKMIESGVSLIEIGIPFSDPIAEGKTIFNADMRALKANTTTDMVFDMVKRIRVKYSSYPIVFMTYLNPVFSYGYEKFFEKSQEIGVLGIIIPDLPFEETFEVRSVAKKYDQVVISMIAPTSKQRIKKIAENAEGFIYLVSSLGVTGVRSEIKTDLEAIVKEIRKYTDVPIAIGFGISNEEAVKKMTKISDGAIVGSAIVNVIEKYGKDAAPYVYDFCKRMVNAKN